MPKTSGPTARFYAATALWLLGMLAVGLNSDYGGSSPGLVYGHPRTSPISMSSNMLCGS
jgi:hypothetical protein